MFSVNATRSKISLSSKFIVPDEGGSFTVIVDGFDRNHIEAAVALLYRGQVAAGSDDDAGAFRSAFAQLIVPNSKVRFERKILSENI